MLDFLKGAANLLAGPMAGVVDFAGNALGLPPLITNSIKVAAGAATGNVMLAASGAMGAAQELSKNPPAKTEYRASSSSHAKTDNGYAPSSSASSSPILGPGSSPLDPKMLDYADALRVLEANFQQLDLVDGKQSGVLSKKDLKRIAADASLSPQLRDAAGFMVENTAFFERLDRQGPLARIGIFSPLYNLDTFTVKDLRRELTVVESEFAKYGRPTRPGGGGSPSVPGPGGGRPTPPPPTTGGTPGGGSTPGVDRVPPSTPSAVDPDLREYHDVLRILDANWDTFDTAAGVKDNRFTRDSLDAILASPAASSTLKRAAQFLKDHPAYFDRLEMAAGVGTRDGIVGRPDVTAALRQVDAERGGTNGSGGVRGTGGTSSNVRSIVDNPNMSIEDKIQAILMSISSDTDEEILDVMEQMANVRDQRATLGTGESDRKAGAKLESSMQELELRLQRLVEKRKAMFDLMSNMSSKFHEMAKTAISNLRSA
ncbi:hypothetical protein A176_001089 [Myxococcus hansupus]|uniref:Uncharacterized protein n=1 Tax=Pseudomyxococcus hansupus TaxID=1297742 RepID=A0A0H4X8K1_9BACT|nr:hypothetical protein [Myxococcus hansupus]AKQ64177.1 hypothetical protein A176_001089 [Myxococcus hansupus]